jgi:hypothetical protein
MRLQGNFRWRSQRQRRKMKEWLARHGLTLQAWVLAQVDEVLGENQAEPYP